jgi:hypothetical protein
MKNLKSYSGFLNEGLFDVIKDSIFGKTNTNIPTVSSTPKEMNTDDLLHLVAEKMKSGDSNPVYIHTKNSNTSETYVMGELSHNLEKFGLSSDGRGKIEAGQNQYSSAILDGAIFKKDTQSFIDGLNNILINNQRAGAKSVIEIQSFSVLSEEIRNVVLGMIKTKKTAQYQLQNGDFFILGDIDGVYGSKDSSQEISKTLGPNSFFNLVQDYTPTTNEQGF